MKTVVFKNVFIYKHDRQSVIFMFIFSYSLLFFLILIKINQNQYKSKHVSFFSCYIWKVSKSLLKKQLRDYNSTLWWSERFIDPLTWRHIWSSKPWYYQRPRLRTLHFTEKTSLRRLKGQVHVSDATNTSKPCNDEKVAKQQMKDVTGGCSPNPACRWFRILLVWYWPETTTSPGSTLNNQAVLFRDRTACSTRRRALKRWPNQSSSLIPQLACRGQRASSQAAPKH